MTEYCRMKERLVRAIATEPFRRNVGPGWQDVAALVVESIIEDLGLVEIEAWQSYPAREQPEAEPYIEKNLRHAFASKLVVETPMSLIIERGKANDYPGMSRMGLRGWVITRSAPHD